MTAASDGAVVATYTLWALAALTAKHRAALRRWHATWEAGQII